MEPAASTIYALSFLAVVIAFAFAVYLHLWVKRQPTENPTIRRVSDLIKAGANTFMRKGVQDPLRLCRRGGGADLPPPAPGHLGGGLA